MGCGNVTRGTGAQRRFQRSGASRSGAGVAALLLGAVLHIAVLQIAVLQIGCVASFCQASPVSPEDASATLTVPADLTAALFASEPLLTSPSDIDVDAMGRVWVCEVTNYRGRRDTRPEGDRILVLEDTDGDGTADKQTVFHQGRDVDSALGICVIGEGPGRKVIVSCAPTCLYFTMMTAILSLTARRRSSPTPVTRSMTTRCMHLWSAQTAAGTSTSATRATRSAIETEIPSLIASATL